MYPPNVACFRLKVAFYKSVGVTQTFNVVLFHYCLAVLRKLDALAICLNPLSGTGTCFRMKRSVVIPGEANAANRSEVNFKKIKYIQPRRFCKTHSPQKFNLNLNFKNHIIPFVYY